MSKSKLGSIGRLLIFPYVWSLSSVLVTGFYTYPEDTPTNAVFIIRSQVDAMGPLAMGYFHDRGLQKTVMRKLKTVGQTWEFLSALGVFWRLHQVARSLLVPFDKLVDHLPDQGILLDLGCGHGLFLALAKQGKPALQLMGLDLSEEKIAAARQAFDASNCPIQYLAATDIAEFPEQSVDVISLIDVLYLVPIEQWESILKRCQRCLKPGGKLLFKEMDRSITWKFALL